MLLTWVQCLGQKLSRDVPVNVHVRVSLSFNSPCPRTELPVVFQWSLILEDSESRLSLPFTSVRLSCPRRDQGELGLVVDAYVSGLWIQSIHPIKAVY